MRHKIKTQILVFRFQIKYFSFSAQLPRNIFMKLSWKLNMYNIEYDKDTYDCFYFMGSNEKPRCNLAMQQGTALTPFSA